MTAAEKVGRLNRLYAVSSGINEAIVRIPEESRLFEEACRIAVEKGGLTMAWVGLAQEGSPILSVAARWGKDDGYLSSVQVHTAADRHEGMGPGGVAFRSGEPAVCNDIASDSRFFASRSEALARGFRSCAAFPLQLHGRPIGIFVTYAAEPLHFDAEELTLLKALADNFSFAIESRRKDRALRQSEARLRAIIDNEPQCVATISADGTLLEMNPAGLRTLQATRADAVVGRPMVHFIHQEDREAYLRLLAIVAAGGSAKAQLRAVGLLGAVRWLELHLVPLHADDGSIHAVLSVSNDVTQERSWLEQLQHSARLLGMASRLGRIGGWEVALPEIRLAWTDELCAIHELPPGFRPTLEEALSFYVPADRPVVEAAFAACCIDGTPFDIEVDLLTRNGRRVHGRSIGEAVRDADGRIERVQGAFQDISERRLAQQEIEQLAERLGTTLDSITDSLVTVDRDWKITYVNRAAERVLQRPREKLLGVDMWEEFPQGRGTVFEQQYAKAIAEGRTMEFEEYFEPLGSWLELRVYPSPQGGLTIYFRDVTERRRAREQVVELNAQLEHRVRERTAQLEIANHELGAFSYSVAHDLRAPLAAIGGFSQALEHELSGKGLNTERGRHYLSRMRAGLQQTHEMIDAMLSLSQLSRAELRCQEVDLAPMARSAFENLRREQPLREVRLQLQEPLPVSGDPRLLRLVLDNLVGNAWKFTAGREQAEIAVGSEHGSEGETVFFVRDNGVGFDLRYAGNLFGAFQRLHSQTEFPGTGVGLANVRRIVTRHGGRIWADSSVGAGATFYFTLGELMPA
jgi:hypothetical protein